MKIRLAATHISTDGTFCGVMVKCRNVRPLLHLFRNFSRNTEKNSRFNPSKSSPPSWTNYLDVMVHNVIASIRCTASSKNLFWSIVTSLVRLDFDASYHTWRYASMFNVPPIGGIKASVRNDGVGSVSIDGI